MAETPEPSGSAYAYNANDLSISYSSYLPSVPEQVPHFLHDAAWAIGCSEAELARKLGVSRATFSGWKARQSIPAKYLDWFGSSDFIGEILKGGRTTELPFKHAGVDAVLFMLHRYEFRLFGKEFPESVYSAGHLFAGLCSLAQFLQWRLPVPTDPHGIYEPTIRHMHVLIEGYTRSSS